jgi:hypothetical protein
MNASARWIIAFLSSGVTDTDQLGSTPSIRTKARSSGMEMCVSLEDATDLQITFVGVNRALHDSLHYLPRSGHRIRSLLRKSFLAAVYLHMPLTVNY